MRVFLVNENNELAMSLVKKINGAVNGQFIPVTPEELKLFKNNGFVPLDLPEDHSGTILRVAGKPAAAVKSAEPVGKAATPQAPPPAEPKKA